ncbi:MAG TPA: HD domain-containing protein [Vicinamibacterales bacterium]|nr:HD domain-containing protein [Vicinamibacterales bacterium]
MTTALLNALRFAARKHRDQRRKGVEASPYVNHVIDVATVLACEGAVTDEHLLLAAILHDTVEDTATTFEELSAEFGRAFELLVREVTDDKSLPKEARKQLQIERARASSPLAKQLKIADKISNVREIALSPPKGWSFQRRTEYFDWAERVVAGCRDVNPALDAAFDAAVRNARNALALAE